MLVACADGRTRKCFPILAATSVDYEEAVIPTAVKSGLHCYHCQVRPNERENISKVWPLRRHTYTSTMVNKTRQAKRTKEKSADNCMELEDYPCFADLHYAINIHTAITTDLLHIFFSNGLVQRFMGCVENIVGDRVMEVIDARIAAVPPYHDMRILNRGYLSIQQFSGVETSTLR